MALCNFETFGKYGWSYLKLVTVGFGSYRVNLKLSRLVKFKLKYVVNFFSD